MNKKILTESVRIFLLFCEVASVDWIVTSVAERRPVAA